MQSDSPRDLRDPLELGSKLLASRQLVLSHPRKTLSELYDFAPVHVRDYVSPEHPHQKYGDPRLLPSTLPN